MLHKNHSLLGIVHSFGSALYKCVAMALLHGAAVGTGTTITFARRRVRLPYRRTIDPAYMYTVCQLETRVTALQRRRMPVRSDGCAPQRQFPCRPVSSIFVGWGGVDPHRIRYCALGDSVEYACRSGLQKMCSSKRMFSPCFYTLYFAFSFRTTVNTDTALFIAVLMLLFFYVLWLIINGFSPGK